MKIPAPAVEIVKAALRGSHSDKIAHEISLKIYPITPTAARKARQLDRQHKAFLSQFIGKDDLVFDVGANTGEKARLFLQLGAKVVCVEPQKACVQRLTARYKRNPNVRIVPKALGDGDTVGEISICDEANTISTMSGRWIHDGRFADAYAWNRKETVPMTTLDALIEEFGIPHYCKIDVEGFEYNVLKGLSRPISLISFEFTKEFLEDARKCMTHLASLGEVEFNCTAYDSAAFRFPDWQTSDSLSGNLSQMDDAQLWGDIYARFHLRE